MTKVLTFVARLIATMLLVGCVAMPARAQAVRTWVSGVGDDANPCSRTAPCKTFAGAISKTATGGEISVLDPGGFGTVTITKAISLVAVGGEGGILASGTNGITINAASTDNVSIRGLVIEGGGTGLNGVRVLQANNVYISNTVIRGFRAGTGFGVDIQPANGPRVYLKNVEIYSNLVGIFMRPTSTTVAGLNVDNCTISGNVTNSAKFDTNASVVRVSASNFATTGLSLTNGAQLISEGNNFFSGGAPAGTTTSPLQ